MTVDSNRLLRFRSIVIDWTAYSFVRGVVAVIQVLPLDMGDRWCRFLAVLLSGPIPLRKRATEENMRRIFPAAPPNSTAELQRQMWHSLLLTACEVAWADRRLHRCNWSKHVHFVGNRTMLAKLLSKRPSVVVTGHYGNFEVGGYVTGVMGIETLTIARKLDNSFLHEWVQRFRGSKGQKLIDKEGCADEVERHLSAGGTLTLLADQHAGDKGCWEPFLGVPASCHKALALFTVVSGAPMLVVTTRRRNRKPMQFMVTTLGIVDPQDNEAATQSVASLTRWYNDCLAKGISQGVEQYWWLHRRWRIPPPKVAKRLAKRSA